MSIDPVNYLPSELNPNIAEYLDQQSLESCCQVSRAWRNVFSDDFLWRNHYANAYSLESRDVVEWPTGLRDILRRLEPVVNKYYSEDYTRCDLCKPSEVYYPGRYTEFLYNSKEIIFRSNLSDDLILVGVKDGLRICRIINNDLSPETWVLSNLPGYELEAFVQLSDGRIITLETQVGSNESIIRGWDKKVLENSSDSFLKYELFIFSVELGAKRYRAELHQVADGRLCISCGYDTMKILIPPAYHEPDQLSEKTIQSLTAAEVGSLACVHRKLIPSLKPEQQIFLRGNAWRCLNDQQISLLDPEVELREFPPDMFDQLSDAQLHRLPAKQIRRIERPATLIQRLLPEQIQSLDVNRVKVLPEEAYQHLTDEQLLHLPERHLHSFPIDLLFRVPRNQVSNLADHQIEHLPWHLLGGLNETRLRRLTGDMIRRVPGDVVGYLSTAQLPFLAETQIPYLTSDQIRALRGNLIRHLSPDQVSHLGWEQLGYLSEEQVTQLPEERLYHLSRELMARIRPGQLAQLSYETSFHLITAKFDYFTFSQKALLVGKLLFGLVTLPLRLMRFLLVTLGGALAKRWRGDSPEFDNLSESSDLY